MFTILRRSAVRSLAPRARAAAITHIPHPRSLASLPTTGLVECVPNFSEGRCEDTIEAIAAACRATDGCTLLDVDPGASTNRTVYTFVGTPAACVDGAINMAAVAKEKIDMTTHSGEHPRFGAMARPDSDCAAFHSYSIDLISIAMFSQQDVCPFVPIRDATMDDCVACAHAFGRRAGDELGLPIYMYEHASTKGSHRYYLPDIREGEYEAVADRVTTEEWAPDYGPGEFVPTWGATASGARKFLVAYNVNLLGTKQQATRIALNLREQGRGPGEEGSLSKVKGIGWHVDDCSVSTQWVVVYHRFLLHLFPLCLF